MQASNSMTFHDPESFFSPNKMNLCLENTVEDLRRNEMILGVHLRLICEIFEHGSLTLHFSGQLVSSFVV